MNGKFSRFVVLPLTGFTLGFGYFVKPWHSDESSLQTLHRSLHDQRTDVLDKLRTAEWVQKLKESSSYIMHRQSEKIPVPHRDYHVGQGLLYGPTRLEIDPVVFADDKQHKIHVIYHLGHNLRNEKDVVHKGVLSLLLDEALCYCGFPTLPSKRGVTASLDISFKKDVPTDSTIVLNAQVVETKGRKCIIKGTLESPPIDPSTRLGHVKSWVANTVPDWLYSPKPTIYATATCVLVEPKWFKYISWINIF
ncbi:unnamed protein product [Kluyveromyces dobzhanskii CBS 2104]|uniref:WGS project CCBQ000000000 data, contig 00106 n=1 Tax=Kluyveromyces dobzhanskii CBS 2104 TaxID=1427455 RepID=A0A0A8L680_9SACH|nr:unnamed protein product [Kluyveromyces dobzhanskii CBS 2104]